MIVEKVSDKSQSVRWHLSEKGKDLAESMRIKRRNRDEALKNSTFVCPNHNEISRFVGLTGSYQIAVPVYQCPEGEKFSVRSGTEIQVLPRQAGIRK